MSLMMAALLTGRAERRKSVAKRTERNTIRLSQPRLGLDKDGEMTHIGVRVRVFRIPDNIPLELVSEEIT